MARLEMEKLMSKLNDTSRELTEGDLDAVSGGVSIPNWVYALLGFKPPDKASPSVTVNGGPLAFASAPL